MTMNSEHLVLPNKTHLRFLLITANTGSIFEKPDLITSWLKEFENLLKQHPSDFVALHCQEIGGKVYEKSMNALDLFIGKLTSVHELTSNFTCSRLYFDSDYKSQETFTALGCAYFFRRNLNAQQWNFTTSSFQHVVNRQILTGNLINVQTLRREKYPGEYFPEGKRSRKGFTQTRWLINGFQFDLLNVHLFHDASNIVAAEQSPSLYSDYRRKALKYTLEKLHCDRSDKVIPYVIFGDFNFRLDAHRLVEHLSNKQTDLIHRKKEGDNNDIAEIIIKHEDNRPKLTIKNKVFDLHDNHDTYFDNNRHEVHTFDSESLRFREYVYEHEKSFPPSYPYSEENHEARSYARSRCPAWCDRILLSHSFKNIIDVEEKKPDYDIIGYDVCMGDHKPVYLSFAISFVQGINGNVPLSKNLLHTTSVTVNDSQTVDTNKNTSQDNELIAIDYDDSVSTAAQATATSSNQDIDDHRTVLARHHFHANIKHTLIRFIRETPV